MTTKLEESGQDLYAAEAPIAQWVQGAAKAFWRVIYDNFQTAYPELPNAEEEPIPPPPLICYVAVGKLETPSLQELPNLGDPFEAGWDQMMAQIEDWVETPFVVDVERYLWEELAFDEVETFEVEDQKR